MNKLKQVSNDQLAFTGYGGQWMKKEGFQSTVEFDIGQLDDKTFTTYRKTKTFNEGIFFRWNPFNLVNKHFTRNTNHVYDLVSPPLHHLLVNGSPTTQEDLLEPPFRYP